MATAKFRVIAGSHVDDGDVMRKAGENGNDTFTSAMDHEDWDPAKFKFVKMVDGDRDGLRKINKGRAPSVAAKDPRALPRPEVPEVPAEDGFQDDHAGTPKVPVNDQGKPLTPQPAGTTRGVATEAEADRTGGKSKGK